MPLIVVFIDWGQRGDGWISVITFSATACISLSVGLVLRILFHRETPDTTASMLFCAVGWLSVSAIGSIPFIIVIGTSGLDAYFEAISGFDYR